MALAQHARWFQHAHLCARRHHEKQKTLQQHASCDLDALLQVEFRLLICGIRVGCVIWLQEQFSKMKSPPFDGRTWRWLMAAGLYVQKGEIPPRAGRLRTRALFRDSLLSQWQNVVAVPHIGICYP